MTKQDLAPIVLFAYNRPVHLAKTLEALRNNTLARQSDLIIYSDAAKKPADQKKVQEVRDLVADVSGFRSVRVIYQEANRGLARSIIEGVTDTLNQHNRAIVLEDDILTSPYFLHFMNDALSFYEHEPKVMHISAYMYPIDSMDLPETFFLKPTSCW